MVSDYIIAALLILMKKKDYKNISITEICEKAGVTRMSFYRNFDSKEDILQKWCTNVTDDFLKDSAISYKSDSTTDYFIKLFTHMQEYREISQRLYKAGLMHIIKEQFDRVFLEIHSGEYDDYKSYFLSGGIYNVYYLWLVHGCQESPAEIALRMEHILEK